MVVEDTIDTWTRFRILNTMYGSRRLHRYAIGWSEIEKFSNLNLLLWAKVAFIICKKDLKIFWDHPCYITGRDVQVLIRYRDVQCRQHMYTDVRYRMRHVSSSQGWASTKEWRGYVFPSRVFGFSNILHNMLYNTGYAARNLYSREGLFRNTRNKRKIVITEIEWKNNTRNIFWIYLYLLSFYTIILTLTPVVLVKHQVLFLNQDLVIFLLFYI